MGCSRILNPSFLILGSDISFGDSPDLPDFGDEDRSPASKETKVASKQQETNQTSGRGRKQSKIKPDDDMFGDDDGLPGEY